MIERDLHHVQQGSWVRDGATLDVVRKALHPEFLKRPALQIELNRVWAVVLSHPLHSLRLGYTGQDCHTCQDGSRSPNASGASDLHVLAPVRPIKRLAYLVNGFLETLGDPEVVFPGDHLVWPGRLPFRISVESELSPLVIHASVGKGGGADDGTVRQPNLLCHFVPPGSV